MKKQSNKLPKTIYVYWNDEDEGWLVAEPTFEACAPEQGEKRIVGEYVLQSESEVSVEVKKNVIVKKK